MTVSKRLRYEILRRDGHACRYCGATSPDVRVTVDHVIPVALGGSDEPANLVTACADCNSGKSASSPDAPIVEDVREDALRWARAMLYAAHVMDADDQHRDEFVDMFDQEWCLYRTRNDASIERPEDWRHSVEIFYRAGATVSDIDRAIYRGMTMARGGGQFVEWRYTCGVIWRRLEERQGIARDALMRGLIDGQK